MYQIKAIAPTHHTLNELRKFGMPIISLGNGSHKATKLFQNLAECHSFLDDRVLFVWRSGSMTTQDMEDKKAEIIMRDRLSFGNITAEIIELEEEETF